MSHRKIHVAIALCLLILSSNTIAQTRSATSKPTGPARWEKNIAAFEEADRANPPPKGAILFTGASSIARWKSLPQDFPDWTVLNRGFGGSMIADATYYADRIIFPYEPKMILLRAGGNDIHAGLPVAKVFQDYKDFVAKVRTKLPDSPIVFISQSATPARWPERDKVKQLNALVEQYSKETPGLKYVEVYDLTITPDGKPREDLYVADKLHPNAEGYRLMAERIRPVLPPKG